MEKKPMSLSTLEQMEEEILKRKKILKESDRLLEKGLEINLTNDKVLKRNQEVD